MVSLKLACLPDRTPVKAHLVIDPALYKRLEAYAEVYKKTYGREEKISILIPFMLASFLDGDREFRIFGKPKKLRRIRGADSEDGPVSVPARPVGRPAKAPLLSEAANDAKRPARQPGTA